jgi:hypothetical protein
MDKWQNIDKGYRTDWPDGIYECTHIIFAEKPLEFQQKHGRIVEIKNGKVLVDGHGIIGDNNKNKIVSFSQYSFFEVNIVISYLKSV